MVHKETVTRLYGSCLRPVIIPFNREKCVSF